jgi:hypothetical protein
MNPSTILIASSLLAGACTLGAPGDRGAPEDPAGLDLHHDLALAPMSFTLEPRPGAALLTASVFDGQRWQEHPTTLDLTGGAVDASIDLDTGLWLDRFELRFADVSLPEDEEGSGFGLTDILVSLDAPHPCDVERWADGDDRVDAEFAVALALDWSLVTRDGTVVPLGSQSLASSVDVTLRRGASGDQVGLSLINPGVMWEWAGLLRIEGVMLTAGGTADAPAPD